MTQSNPKLIAGIVTPTLLKEWEGDVFYPLATQALQCHVLEIRYDLFENKLEWPTLCARVRKLAPQAILLATLRLVRDGGLIPNEHSADRIPHFKDIISAQVAPQWIDLEQEELVPLHELQRLAQNQGIHILASRHDFSTVPTLETLQSYVLQAKIAKVDGFKIAAMSTRLGDCENLYTLIQQEWVNFTWFSAFAMGQTGQESRIHSYFKGANLNYGAIGPAVAPGQISVESMVLQLKNP